MRAEVHTGLVAREIVRGLFDQLYEDGRIRNDQVGSVALYEDNSLGALQSQAKYWDDISGKELDPNKVRIARQEEMAEFRFY